jgi:ketosteroid isomerase-like protein
MSLSNKEIIRKVNEGFGEGNTEKILLYVAEDVTWQMPGGFSLQGKEAFGKEASNNIMASPPVITVKNEISEGNMVAVEGHVTCEHKDGSTFTGAFFDFYRLENGKIKEMRSYVIPTSK